MAKMKIYEIARSIQAKNKEIKSGDLVKLLNENGFEVKGANSNIEDKEIAFLLQTFNDPKKVEKILASQRKLSRKKIRQRKRLKKNPKRQKQQKKKQKRRSRKRNRTKRL